MDLENPMPAATETNKIDYQARKVKVLTAVSVIVFVTSSILTGCLVHQKKEHQRIIQEHEAKESTLEEQLKQEEDAKHAMITARDALISERDDLICQKTTLIDEKASLTSERAALISKKNSLITEKEALISGTDATIHNLQVQLANAGARNDEQMRECAKQLDQVWQEVEVMRQEDKRQLEELRQQNAQLEKEKQAVHEWRVAKEAEHDKELQDREVYHDELLRDNKELRSRLLELEDRGDELRKKNEAQKVEIERLLKG